MMRIPETAPSFAELIAGFRPEEFIELVKTVEQREDVGGNGIYRGRYVHWQDLKYLPIPTGMTAKLLWAGLKFQRRCAVLPLVDRTGQPFRYCTPDMVSETLLFLDQNASGQVQMLDDQIINPDTRDRYLVNSLIEEAIRSSQLEGAVTTRRVAKEMIRSGRQPLSQDERMILNNYRTMQHITSLKDEELTPELVLGIQKMVTEGTLDDPADAGRFRRGDDIRVYSAENEVLHVPPAAGELQQRMRAMCEFANGKTPKGFLHPVLRAIVLHFWLAYDHPFLDGNGRTARALFYWSMLRQGYWLCEFVSISQIVHNAPSKYAQAFLRSETDENDLTYFIVYHLRAIKRAIDELHAYVRRKTDELHSLERQSRKLYLLNHRQKALISHALRYPDSIYTFESHRLSHGVVRETARRDLLELAERGYLESRKIGKARSFVPARDLAERLSSPVSLKSRTTHKLRGRSAGRS